MTTVRASALIDASDGAVRRVLARVDVWTRTARASGLRADVAGQGAGPRAALQTGDLLRLRSDRPARWWTSLVPRRSLIFSTTVTGGLPGFDLVAGPPRRGRVGVTTEQTAGGTLVTVGCEWQATASLSTLVYRRRMLAAGRLLLGIVRLAAAETEVVVAGAIIQDGRVLAARRTHPPALAGLWELPGGKVQPGETAESALERELAEELGVAVTVDGRIGRDVNLGHSTVLQCFRVTLERGRPSPTVHDELRWVGPDELATLPWLPADALLGDELRDVLAR